MTRPLRIGTRGSKLALTQTQIVAEMLSVDVEIVPITTTGDTQSKEQLAASQNPKDEIAQPSRLPSDKSRWIDTLEQALINGQIDIAVHSAKDVPGELTQGCVLMATPARGPAQDVLVTSPTKGDAFDLQSLPPGAKVGTSSLRRQSQLYCIRPDIEVLSSRGNVDTRLSHLTSGKFDALVLAGAGLERLQRNDTLTRPINDSLFIPAPGQGTLVIQGRANDRHAAEICAEINDWETWITLETERALVARLGAGCLTPVGAHATVTPGDGGKALEVRAFVGAPDGSSWLIDQAIGSTDQPLELGVMVAERMISAGAEKFLAME